MSELLLLFIILNIINVMLQTFKTICTISGSKLTAAIVNAIAYGYYTIVVIYMLCDLPTITKALVVGACNLVGVYIVKYIEEKRAKDKLWKIEFTVRKCCKEEIVELLNNDDISFNYTPILKEYVVFNAYCSTKESSEKVKTIIDTFGAKYFVSESKNLY